MSSIYVTKLVTSTHSFAGKEWFYDFRELPHRFNEKKCIQVSSSLSERYSKLTKVWNPDKNSEWICRMYLSAKMIMTATLHLNTLTYANEQNLRVVSPYLTYYSLLSLLRSIVYTLPEVKWDDGNLVKISHKKAINLAIDHIDKFNRPLSIRLKENILTMKAFRELVSYRSPTSGDKNIKIVANLESTATLLAEVAQFNSEILEDSIMKNADKNSFIFLDHYIFELSSTEIEGICFFDDEDNYRLGYLARKYPIPPNILFTMTEGHVEDFFGAWVSPEENFDIFDPDEDVSLIFDIEL